ncbi:molybdopterin molybdenumtransferase MoeA [Cohnella sp. CFH 77786]|uniref:molybdopterin molybdotransferase MoeA n=1 Tax=Cohnella sp. CFH 77786 TaxID=2662265 RepID=UPI001C60E6AF|nr:gephyrin-like molybdotransferase Glp [Cohnella sp. CFH 77786]MBW5445020.1 molybdopterin molybdenumtransferase MoeA [Cohnella sp. CFH 77786]
MTTSPLPERFRRQAVSPEEALGRVLARVRPLETETVPLFEAWRRRLAEPVAAPHPFPPFRRSAMDGYAVRAADLPAEGSSGEALLQVLESLPAGAVPRFVVGPGQASRIMTGAMLPEGADTVVMLEMTETVVRAGADCVRIRKHVPKGRNVADVGSEVAAGVRLFGESRLIGAGETALLASLGMAGVPVVRRPRVGVLATGSELLEAAEPLAPGRIRNSNAPMLAALLREAGAEPVLYGRAADRPEEAEAMIRRGLAECDLLLTTGGVSVGDRDILVDILAGWEGETLFNKVTMRPGSPTTAAVLDGKLLLALSGNPGACFVGFQLFAVPALRTMLRHPMPERAAIQARLAEAFPKVNAYSRYVRSRLEVREGTVWVRPAGDDFSSLMTTIAEADSLVVLPPLKEGLEQGALVTVIPLAEGMFGS